MKKITSAFVLCFFATTYSLACSMAKMPEPPRSIVNPGMYIFVGEVIGYTKPISDPGNFRGIATGVKLKIVESIQFPYFQNDYVELFMFSHGADCFPEADSTEPPIGARYRLALYPAGLVATKSQSHMRLQSGVFDRISPDETMFGFSTTANAMFDYKKYLRPLRQKFKAAEMADKWRWIDDFLYIEASKDLLRLQKATSEAERMNLLERLLYCPNINYHRLLSSEVGKPFGYDVGDFSAWLLSPESGPKYKPRALSKKEKQLFAERLRLESSGELNN